jgi:hypothetical protein
MRLDEVAGSSFYGRGSGKAFERRGIERRFRQMHF